MDLLKTFRMKYETLLCHIYGFVHPTGERGATAAVYDSMVAFTTVDEKGKYDSPDDAWREMREVASYLDAAISFAMTKYQDSHIQDELARCLLALNNLSVLSINNCIDAAGLAIGLFHKD